MCEVHPLPAGGETQVKLLKGLLVGGVVVSATQLFAPQVSAQQAAVEASTASEISLLKARLKQLEHRVENQARKEKQIEAEAQASPRMPATKPGPLACDPCPAGKICYKGVTLTFGGWIDLAAISRSRNIASDTGSVYSSIPFAQARNFKTGEARFSARQSRFSLLAEGDAAADTHLAGYGEIDFE